MNDKSKFVLLPISGCISETITYPIDSIKTLMHVSPKKNAGFIETLKYTTRNHGYKKVFVGLKPALLRQAFSTMIRISLFEKFSEKKRSVGALFLVGGSCGAIAQFIVTPVDLLKVRFITNPDQNKSIIGSLLSVYKMNGFTGMYRGVASNCSRGFLANAGELAGYSTSKNFFKKKGYSDDFPLHVGCSVISGFCSALFSTPADVIKSKIMKTGSNYNGILDCIHKTYKFNGIKAFFNGFLPIWLRLGPWQLTFYVSYEQLRKMMNLKPAFSER